MLILHLSGSGHRFSASELDMRTVLEKSQVKDKGCFFNLDTIWIELDIKLDVKY